MTVPFDDLSEEVFGDEVWEGDAAGLRVLEEATAPGLVHPADASGEAEYCEVVPVGLVFDEE